MTSQQMINSKFPEGYLVDREQYIRERASHRSLRASASSSDSPAETPHTSLNNTESGSPNTPKSNYSLFPKTNLPAKNIGYAHDSAKGQDITRIKSESTAISTNPSKIEGKKKSKSSVARTKVPGISDVVRWIRPADARERAYVSKYESSFLVDGRIPIPLRVLQEALPGGEREWNRLRANTQLLVSLPNMCHDPPIRAVPIAGTSPFRLLDLPPPILRKIFRYVLVKQKVVPYRYTQDPEQAVRCEDSPVRKKKDFFCCAIKSHNDRRIIDDLRGKVKDAPSRKTPADALASAIARSKLTPTKKRAIILKTGQKRIHRRYAEEKTEHHDKKEFQRILQKPSNAVAVHKIPRKPVPNASIVAAVNKIPPQPVLNTSEAVALQKIYPKPVVPSSSQPPQDISQFQVKKHPLKVPLRKQISFEEQRWQPRKAPQVPPKPSLRKQNSFEEQTWQPQGAPKVPPKPSLRKQDSFEEQRWQPQGAPKVPPKPSVRKHISFEEQRWQPKEAPKVPPKPSKLKSAVSSGTCSNGIPQMPTRPPPPIPTDAEQMNRCRRPPTIERRPILEAPCTNLLIALCSKANGAVKRCRDQALNVLFGDNVFEFEELEDLYRFQNDIDPESKMRMDWHKNLKFTGSFWNQVTEVFWMEMLANGMLGMRAWAGGWEEREQMDKEEGQGASTLKNDSNQYRIVRFGDRYMKLLPTIFESLREYVGIEDCDSPQSDEGFEEEAYQCYLRLTPGILNEDSEEQDDEDDGESHYSSSGSMSSEPTN